MRFSTFHSFMLTDAKGQEGLLEGQAIGDSHHDAIGSRMRRFAREILPHFHG